MAQYCFTITNGERSSYEEDLMDDDAAWSEAVHTVRDIESALGLDEVWTITVSRDDKPIFRIDVRARRIG